MKCEKWIRDDDHGSEGSKTTWWLNRLIGRTKKVSIDWPYPFAEEKLFVLTLSAGLEGYHVNVDGRHVTSFPYRTVSMNMNILNCDIDSFWVWIVHQAPVTLAGICSRGCDWAVTEWQPTYPVHNCCFITNFTSEFCPTKASGDV